MKPLALVFAAGCASSPVAPLADDPIPPDPPPAACAAEASAATHAGVATYYDVSDAGQCSLDRSLDRRVAALNPVDYAAGTLCGACLLVTGPEGQVIVRVDDTCPACKPGEVDLGRNAFALIAPLDAGRVPVAWRVVDCPIRGPLAYRFKDGTNAAWAAVQVRNHRHAIASVEARDPAGAYVQLVRTDYNYFVGTGLGAGPLALRVTDVLGHVVEESIPLGDDVERTGTQQLAACR